MKCLTRCSERAEISVPEAVLGAFGTREDQRRALGLNDYEQELQWLRRDRTNSFLTSGGISEQDQARDKAQSRVSSIFRTFLKT